jgi:hypothetical protein
MLAGPFASLSHVSSTMELLMDQLWLSSVLRRPERANEREHERERDDERIECGLGVPALTNARRGTSRPQRAEALAARLQALASGCALCRSRIGRCWCTSSDRVRRNSRGPNAAGRHVDLSSSVRTR